MGMLWDATGCHKDATMTPRDATGCHDDATKKKSPDRSFFARRE